VPDRSRIRILRQSRKQEERTAKAYRGSRNAMSGAGWVNKNDVKTEDFLIENKFTNNRRSITLKAIDLETLARNAIVSARTPMLQFDLNGRRYIVLREDDGPLSGIERG
jgi:hypothetical protein